MIRPRNGIHHIVPSTRAFVKMRHADHNKVNINRELHNRFHALFLNRVPEEILDLLVNYFWGGDVAYIERFLSFDGDSCESVDVVGRGNGKYGIYWKSRNYQKRFERQFSAPLNDVHHIFPLSRGGAEGCLNTVRVNSYLHELYHKEFFMDRTPEEILDLLVNYFWGGATYFLRNYLVLLKNLDKIHTKFHRFRYGIKLEPFHF